AYHFYGDEDENVPAISAQKFFIEGKSQRFIIEGADHQNWPLFWVEIKAILAENSDINL
ncbi:MAG: hypothetical protein ACJAWS_003339, partial [Oleiphilaceae bacterium]